MAQEHAAKAGATGPLAGLKVIDFSAVLSGPLAAAMLAEQGAQVIKVETPDGDTTRLIGPGKGRMSAMFIASNRGKQCIALDLKQAAARDVALALVREADVLVENMRPGAMDRLGLGYAATSALNPRLVYLTINGNGPDGPDAGARVYDGVVQARSGFCAMNAHPQSGEPMLLPSAVFDKITALTAAQAVSSALYARERDGRGRHVQVAMLDAAIAFQWPDAMYNHVFLDDAPPASPEFLVGQVPWKTRDGHVATNTAQQSEFNALCKALGRPEMAQDPRFSTTPGRQRHGNEMRALLSPLAAALTTDEVLARFFEAGVPVGRVNRRDEVAGDPQVVHNRLLHAVRHGDLGRVRLARGAARFGGAPDAAPQPAGQLGEHTRQLLQSLGYADAAIDALLASGAAVQFGGPV
ncbi:CaiB/BaiF CoA-transferase family protein [Pseudorhodoferax sp. Leaf267]|uniref:CaiB/BaiF CoA transferase family protein n=1 Tax=Pseudorhodoferax sp. Leaf267 TaxID=1736316 RepID=UPI0006F3703C|nr:CoA transferase [Pseudorhodoferax sp. Leaf267]KQP22450.1 hypothetical protein ASF43_00510 [Pseudorhodoferax sp. Leaf267]